MTLLRVGPSTTVADFYHCEGPERYCKEVLEMAATTNTLIYQATFPKLETVNAKHEKRQFSAENGP